MSNLTGAILAVAPRQGHRPAGGFEADDEREFEKGLMGCSWWDGRITDTHRMGGVTLLAATDYARSFAELFTTPHTPRLGHGESATHIPREATPRRCRLARAVR
jgi:hypothetical protein